MTVTVATLGFPRIGPRRELKTALESYWAKKTDEASLLATAAELRSRAWARQRELGADIVPDVLAANPHAAIAFMSGDGPGATDAGHAWIVKGGDTKKALAIVEGLARDALTRAGGAP